MCFMRVQVSSYNVSRRVRYNAAYYCYMDRLCLYVYYESISQLQSGDMR